MEPWVRTPAGASRGNPGHRSASPATIVVAGIGRQQVGDPRSRRKPRRRCAGEQTTPGGECRGNYIIRWSRVRLPPPRRQAWRSSAVEHLTGFPDRSSPPGSGQWPVRLRPPRFVVRRMLAGTTCMPEPRVRFPRAGFASHWCSGNTPERPQGRWFLRLWSSHDDCLNARRRMPGEITSVAGSSPAVRPRGRA